MLPVTCNRKLEEAHDWLCSLADNAVTARESENMLKQLYAGMDAEKARGMSSLMTALNTYKEQHAAILEAITVFAGRIHQHASDYLQREQLVSRAFLQYLLSIVSGEIKTHTADTKKNTYAWETKSIADRGQRKEAALVAEFHANINPLDKMTETFKERMRLQLDHITMRLQSVLNGRENDVNARKAKIHRKLAKHVNKACNARRQRLKDSTAVRRDEFELESKCAQAVESLSSNLRTSIDQVWVKEHLRERRIYEAATGRMERLEKSALIIWNKHAHLATDQHEEYEDWLRMYRKERDLRISERRQQIDRDWRGWRTAFGTDLRSVAVGLRQPVKKFLADSYTYDVAVPVEKNLADLKLYIDSLLQGSMAQIARLRSNVANYLQVEIDNTDEFARSRKQALLLDWQENLYLLNSAINRRVGGLKDMEADLEETIRMSILQHEVENGVFEQLSCARLEQFWLEWRAQTAAMAKEVREHQEDYQISKNAGKVKSRATRADRALDDLVQIAKDHAPGMGAPQPGQGGRQHGQQGLLAEGSVDVPPTVAQDSHTDAAVDARSERTPSDTMRLKRILDDIRPEIYREFTHKITRGLERVRRDLGEGKKRLVPPYAVAKALLAACDVFWDKAKLSERCVGRISSRGVLLFAKGLPPHARALFGVSSTMFVVSEVSLKEEVMGVDCDDVFQVLEEVKKVFMIGLLSISQQVGEFGAYFMRSECAWACSALNIDPPGELLMKLDAKGMPKEHLEHSQPTGFYSDDPVDLSNSVLALTTELMEVKTLQENYTQQVLAGEAALAAERARRAAGQAEAEAEYEPAQQEDGMSVSVAFTNDEPGPGHLMLENGSMATGSLTDDNRVVGYKNEAEKLSLMLLTQAPYLQQLHRMAFLLPAADTAVMAAFLGRPDGSMEMTAHRVCQVVTFWRRTALAIVQAAYDPPSTEYPRVRDLVTAHTAAISGTKRTGGNISCVSPFEAVSSAVDWVTSIRGLPLSLNQGLCILSRGGSVDPWLEDPKQTGRSNRIIYEIKEFLEAIASDIPRSMNHGEFCQAALPEKISDVIGKLDLNYAGIVPLEALRTYLQREDHDLTNTQVSLIYWSLCRVNDGAEDDMTVNNSLHDSYQTFQTGGVYRPVVQTTFLGDPEPYMERFGADVDKYLNSMPTIDTNVILGYLPATLQPASAHELVSDAMKLDASARNPMPATCCVWLGARGVQLGDALSAVAVDHPRSKGGNLLLGVGPNSFHGRRSADSYRANVRTYVELDLLSKYPELCVVQASNKHYGPAGNDPILAHQGDAHADHWQELMTRRLNRMDKLTIAWRDIMMNEWATSLYQSRQQRYLKRVEIVKQCVGVYHQQYAKLKESIVAERNALISQYAGIEAELLSLIQEDYLFFSFHTSFLERALRRYEGQMYRLIVVIGDVMHEFQRHCGSIKRRGIERIAAASDQLRADLEVSCNGLIMGYTAGYAQAYFDELVYRGEVWRNTLTDLQGRLILEKERFASAKEEIDRDLTIQISDRLTVDRNAYKGHLEHLAEDTAVMLDKVATTRASYASVQKDANARLILRIEKAVRESRKLRVAAEQQAELEGPAMRDIRVVLDTARNSCVDIVGQIKHTCLKQLQALHPLRAPHRERMEARVAALRASWAEVERVLLPLVEDYRKEVYKHLALTKSQCMAVIGKYRETEASELRDQYATQRAGLIAAFRKHFRDYDLSEAAIFERFNREVVDTVSEMNLLWGPSRPKFIAQGLQEIDNILTEALASGYADVTANMYALNVTNDDNTMQRMEVVDTFCHSLSKCADHARRLPVQYVTEKRDQLVMVDEMSMEKNGDMVRPQVKAVLDLLLSGIEIASDFGRGYESLQVATQVKASECASELREFNDRYCNAANPLSIDYSASLTLGRIDQRRQEVTALVEASSAHLVADHSRLDVLLQAGEKDIEEWASLTLQLVENAFHNAEASYLSNLWPTPPTTPRLQLVAEDEDRVGKLKALLSATHAGNVSAAGVRAIEDLTDSRRLHTASTASGGGGLGNREDMALAILGGALEDDEDVQEAARARRKEQRRLEKEAKRQEKERLQRELEAGAVKPIAPKLKPEETRELQQGWFECVTPEGFTYYFNPQTDESLWQLPQFLLAPLHPDDESSKALETPRDFLMLEGVNQAPPETVPMRVVPAEFTLKVVLDPAVLMTQVAEEARAAAALAVDTAMDVTSVIRGKRGKDEKTIASLLGDKFNPSLLKKAQPYDSYSEEALLLPSKRGVPSETMSVADSAASVGDNGRVIQSDTASQDGDPELQEMLLSLGLGVGSSMRQDVLPSVEEELAQASELVLPANTTQWLQLGLGGTSTMGDREADSGSDGEDHTGYKDEALKRRAEQRYNESRELDAMAREDELSIRVENYQENLCCNNFMQHLQRIVDTNHAVPQDKVDLLKLNAIIKPINVVDIMATLKTSWRRLDEIILETAAREKARAELEERLRTEEGLKRQSTILEHAEDIEELADFLHVAGLSKSTAKRAATELVLRNISTPKKLAKLWSRQQVALAELGIDADDIEELEAALRQLLLNASASTHDVHGMSQHSAVHWQPGASPFDSAFLPSLTLNNSSTLQLDPALVTEVADVEGGDYDEDEGADQVTAAVPPAQGKRGLARVNSTKQFSFTKEGYKSFVGGWVECFTEDGSVYYYNTASGESAWKLPGARDEDEEEMVEDLRDDEPEAPPAPAYQPQHQHQQYAQQPSNTFAQSYDEYGYPTSNAEYWYDEAGQAHYYDQPQDGYGAQGYEAYSAQQYPAGQWQLSDALGGSSSTEDPSEVPRTLPVPPKAEVIVYSKKEGVSRQMALLSAQDRWQNALVQCQHLITEQKSQYLQMRVDMFEKVSQRVETRLSAFVEDIKVMQKALKQDLGDSMSTERDLRRLFEQGDGQSVVRAEKLSFILESLEKFKVVASERYESSFAQIDKFGAEWELLKTELLQVGDIYDDGVAANLEQVRNGCVIIYAVLSVISRVYSTHCSVAWRVSTR
jgi:hypothetical protein